MELFSQDGSRSRQLLWLAVGFALLAALAIGAGRQAFASHAFPGGDGSAGKPYLILTAEDLDHVRDELDAHYVLGADIDLSSFGNWEPIGTGSSPFTGSFNGGDFKIAGLKIATNNGDGFYGLFGFAQGAVLENIHLRDVQLDVTGSNVVQVGALAGSLQLAEVRNVSVTGSIRTDAPAGGIAGGMSASTVSDSYSTADVSGGEYSGGLIGFLLGSTFERSYATANVTGANAGGLVGSIDYSTIVDSFAIGNAISEAPGGAAGGLIGQVRLGLSNSEVRNSYALGRAEGIAAGGLIGKLHIYDTIGSLTLDLVYWNADANPGLRTIGSETGDAEKRRLDDLKKEITFAGWDFNHVWGITEGESTPYLLVFKPEFELDAPSGPGTPVYSAVDGHNKVTATGSLLDPSIGEMLDLSYEVKDAQGATVKQAAYGSVMATVHPQPLAIELRVGDGEPLDLQDGSYTLEIIVADTVAGSNPAEHRKTAGFAFAVDRTPPVIHLNGDATITLTEGGSFDDPGASATDAREGDLTGDIVVTGTVNPNVPGTYELKYSVRDSVGNAAEAVRTVIVNARPSPRPATSLPLSGNNRLASLKLLDGTDEIGLTPPFSAATLVYEAETDKEQLTIAAEPEHYAASVTVNGQPVPRGGLEVELEAGDNEFKIEVRAENGNVQTYQLTIRRSEPEPEPVCPFGDIRGHWAEEIICDSFALRLVNGASKTRFEPDRQVTRLEMALMLERLVEGDGAALPARLPFADASDIPAWAEEAVRAAVAKGIVNGYPDGAFRPHRIVSREEMAAMLVNAARAMMAELPNERQAAAAIGRFADAPAISGWARGYVGIAAAQGWMQGKGNGRFEPHAHATRAEAAATILRLWRSLQP